MLRGQVADIAVGSVFLFVGFATGSIAAIRRRAPFAVFAWLGVWSAMYGALRLSQSPAVIMGSPDVIQIYAPYLNTAIGYLIVVPALLAFRELTRGGLRAPLLIAAWTGLAIAVIGMLAFVATGSRNVLMPYNSLLAASTLLMLMCVVAVPRLSARYLLFQSRVLVVGTFGFAVEALYNNIARPLGLPQLPFLDHIGFALLLFSLAYVALELVFRSERRLLAVESELEVAHTIQMEILPDGVPSIRGAPHERHVSPDDGGGRRLLRVRPRRRRAGGDPGR